MVYERPEFVDYFRHATPEPELAELNIGSRPARRGQSKSGVESLRAIPWQFAWTQNRLLLPSWLGIEAAIDAAGEDVLGPKRDSFVPVERLALANRALARLIASAATALGKSLASARWAQAHRSTSASYRYEDDWSLDLLNSPKGG